MKKQVFTSALVVIMLLTPLSVFAEKPVEKKSEVKKIMKEERKELQQNVKEEKKEAKEKIKEETKELKKEIKEDKKGFVEKVKDLVKNVINKKNNSVKILQGQVTAINDTSLSVSKDGKDYSVNTDSKTQFRRHFWGKSSISEISVGDNVNISGKFTDEDQTSILAKMVRDTSIQKRKGVFFGTVTSTTDTTLIIDTKRGVETVTFNGNTKFVTRDEKAMTSEDINMGDRIRVKGLWDKTLNTISDVTQVKDFTQPEKSADTELEEETVEPSVSPSSSPSVSPTITSSPTPAL